MAVGCYPGSFDPPTLAHLAIVAAAIERCELQRVDLVVSRVALIKEHVTIPVLADRLAVLSEIVAAHHGLGLVVSDQQLLVDLASGYDVLVLGADKWAQVRDPRFYGGSPAARDAAMAALPPLAFVSRPGHDEGPLPVGTVRLLLADGLAEMSSTAARAGHRHWMAPEARAFDDRTGAWTDPARYRQPG